MLFGIVAAAHLRFAETQMQVRLGLHTALRSGLLEEFPIKARGRVEIARRSFLELSFLIEISRHARSGGQSGENSKKRERLNEFHQSVKR